MLYNNYKCKKLGNVEDLILKSSLRKKLKKNQVRVKVLAIGLNYVDTLMIKGTYQYKNKIPFIPGTEACGVVVEQNCNNKKLLNKKTIIISKNRCFSEEIILEYEELILIKKNISNIQGSSFFMSSLTAYIALKEIAKVKKKDVLLITGASGAIGKACINLALHLGLDVICIVGNNKKLEVIKKMGIKKVLNIKGDIKKKIMDFTNQKGVNIALDINGFLKCQNILSCIKWRGKYLIVGFTDNNITSIKTNYILIKGLQIFGVRAGEYLRNSTLNKRKIIIKKVFQLFDLGVFNIKEYKIITFNKLIQGLVSIRDRKSMGKIIVKTKYYTKY